MKKLLAKDMQSEDIVKQNIEKLKELFPEVFSEDKIKFEQLEELLGNYVNQDEDHYNFTWHGKRKAGRLAQTPSTGTLRPAKDESVDFDNTQNLFIEGDNLEVLKLLQKSYHRKVKMIYIDPPYNTGNDFVYEDDFKDGIKHYLKMTGQTDESGKKLGTNSNSAGRYHTNWLNMMYPRLKLARNLLQDDGVIFISIDDNELDNLIKICNEIFGEENFINLISVKAKDSSGASGGGEDRRLKKNIEHLLCFSKSQSFRKFNDIYKVELLIKYINDRKDAGKGFAYTKILTKEGSENYLKTIKDGSGNDIEVYTVSGYEIKTVSQLAKEENIEQELVYEKYFESIFTTENAQTSIRDRVANAAPEHDGLINIYYKPVSGRNKGKRTRVSFEGKTKRLVSYLSGVAERSNEGIIKKDKVGTLWDDLSWSSVSLEGGVPYPNGKKPTKFIQRMLELCFEDNESGLVLDYFAGSCSTAHACFLKSLESKQSINSISIQLPEEVKPADKAQYYSKNNLSFVENVCDISKERIRRASKKIKEENPDYQGDLGFKVFKLDSSNIKRWEAGFDSLKEDLIASVDYIKNDRSNEDIVFEILLKYGLDLTLPIETRNIAGKEIYIIGLGALIICLDDGINMEVVNGICALKEELSPEIMRVVFSDNGFRDDVIKTNAITTLKRSGIEDIKSL
ncbi:site-specific DNA-methyltransferase [Rickettsiales bacterium]|nr:site-specific DNA-methyltransferase [Rickettsiales bacterium]